MPTAPSILETRLKDRLSGGTREAAVAECKGPKKYGVFTGNRGSWAREFPERHRVRKTLGRQGRDED